MGLSSPWRTGFGGIVGVKTMQRKKTLKGLAGRVLHFLLKFKVSPAPGTAITSLDCSRIPLLTVQKAPSCYQEIAQEGLH